MPHTPDTGSPVFNFRPSPLNGFVVNYWTKAGFRGRVRGAPREYGYGYGYGYDSGASEFVLGLASPGAFPCPEASPSYNVQFSKTAGDGHYLAFGTEVCCILHNIDASCAIIVIFLYVKYLRSICLLCSDTKILIILITGVPYPKVLYYRTTQTTNTPHFDILFIT